MAKRSRIVYRDLLGKLTKEGERVKLICEAINASPQDEGWKGIGSYVAQAIPAFYSKFDDDDKFLLKLQSFSRVGAELGFGDPPKMRHPGLSTADLLDF